MGTGSIRTVGKMGARLGNAHVFAWERVNGRTPEGLELHHTCLNRACCNLEHLELLTHADHKAKHAAMRSTWGCGHPKEPGAKFCRPCRNAYARSYQQEWRKSHQRKR